MAVYLMNDDCFHSFDSMTYDLDDTDRRILGYLARDGRATFEEIAQAVGLRRPSVHERVKKLEKAGVIRGYHAALSPDDVDAGLVAYVFLKVSPTGKDCLTRCGELAERLRRLPEVLEFHTVAGAEDALVKVRARDVRDLERLVLKEISGTPGVHDVVTKIVLSTQFERPLTVARAPALVARKRR